MLETEAGERGCGSEELEYPKFQIKFGKKKKKRKANKKTLKNAKSLRDHPK